MFDTFGTAVALSNDGNTMVAGASGEASNASGIDGNQADNSEEQAGAAYVFTRAGATWSQQAYIKASNHSDVRRVRVRALDLGRWQHARGRRVAENSDATGIDGNQNDNSATDAGATYMFTRTGTTWSQQAYIKASNAAAHQEFGGALAISGDGQTLAVGGYLEASDAIGFNGNQADTSAPGAGALYVFTRAGATWVQQAYVKASNTDPGDEFGSSVSLSSNGSTCAVGATNESSAATGVGGDQTDNSATDAGAVYVISR